MRCFVRRASSHSCRRRYGVRTSRMPRRRQLGSHQKLRAMAWLGVRRAAPQRRRSCAVESSICMALIGVALACRGPLPCEDCDEDDVPTDLPCGGADFETDNSNCGECGNACELELAGTAYETGSCRAGVCGTATWYRQSYHSVPIGERPPPRVSCDELCAEFGSVCVYRGCSEKTGYSCDVLFGFGCSLREEDALPWTGPCADGVPWVGQGDPGSGSPVIGCCCESVEP